MRCTRAIYLSRVCNAPDIAARSFGQGFGRSQLATVANPRRLSVQNIGAPVFAEPFPRGGSSKSADNGLHSSFPIARYIFARNSRLFVETVRRRIYTLQTFPTCFRSEVTLNHNAETKSVFQSSRLMIQCALGRASGYTSITDAMFELVYIIP